MNANLTVGDSDIDALDSGVETHVGLAGILGGVLEMIWRVARSWWPNDN